MIESAAHVAGIAIERTRTEHAVKREQQRLQTLMDNAPDAIYFKDLDSRFLRVNRAQAAYLGLDSPKDAIGRGDAEFFPAEAAAQYKADEQRVIATGDPIIGKIENNGATGSALRWFSTTKVAYRRPDGTIIGTIGISRDITELKRLEDALRQATEEVEAKVRERTAELSDALDRLKRESAERQRAEKVLRESEDRYRLLHEGVGYLVWEYDRDDRRFEIVSSDAEQLLGYDREEWQRPGFWHDHLHPDDRDWVLEFGRKHYEEHRDSECEYRMLDRNGDPAWIKDVTSIVSADNGYVRRTRGIFIDVTARKEAELQAKRQQVQLARVTQISEMVVMAAALSHELNQPLQSIMTFAETSGRELSSPTGDKAVVLSDLHQISIHAERAAELMRSLRSFARSERPRPVATNINELVLGVAALLDAAARQAGVHVETRLQSSLPDVPIDRMQLQQALLNLANNGIEAMASIALDERCLTFETREHDDGTIEITVHDTGPGLSAEVAEEAFEPFFTTKTQGMGLGLALARRVVEMHRGSLTAANRERGGATFTIRLAGPTLAT